MESIEKTNTVATTLNEADTYVPEEYQPEAIDEYELVDREKRQKAFDEFVASCKEDRVATKRALSADNASRANVQNQNAKTIEICERELRKPNISEEYKSQLIQTMNEARNSSVEVDRDSREFQKQELRHMHALPWILVGGAGGAAGLWLLARCIRIAA